MMMSMKMIHRRLPSSWKHRDLSRRCCGLRLRRRHRDLQIIVSGTEFCPQQQQQQQCRFFSSSGVMPNDDNHDDSSSSRPCLSSNASSSSSSSNSSRKTMNVRRRRHPPPAVVRVVNDDTMERKQQRGEVSVLLVRVVPSADRLHHCQQQYLQQQQHYQQQYQRYEQYRFVSTTTTKNNSGTCISTSSVSEDSIRLVTDSEEDDDDDDDSDDEDDDPVTKQGKLSLDQMSVVPWSLQSLADTAGSKSGGSSGDSSDTAVSKDDDGLVNISTTATATTHHAEGNIERLVLDLAVRLHRQSYRLDGWKAIIEQASTMQLNYYDDHDDGGGDEHSRRVLLEDAAKIVHALVRLHKDTLDQAMHLYRQWTKTTTTTGTSNYKSKRDALVIRQVHKTAAEIQARHAMTIEQAAELVIGLRQFVEEEHQDRQSPQLSQELLLPLDVQILPFLQARLTIQLLCDHLTTIGKRLELQSGQNWTADRYNSTTAAAIWRMAQRGGGAVSLDQNVESVVEAALVEASQLCEAHFLTKPAVHIISSDAVDDDDTTNNITATFIRPWLQYTLVELLKNGMAATIESQPNLRCGNRLHPMKGVGGNKDDSDDDDDDDDDDIDKNLRPIFVTIAETDTDVVIRIMDQGGGLPNTPTTKNTVDGPSPPSCSIGRLFAFAQCRQKWDRLDDQQTYATTRSPMRGLGVGLAMSRMQMQHFGGDLELHDRRRGRTKTRDGGGDDDDGDDDDPADTLARNDELYDNLEPGVTAIIRIPKDATIPSTAW